MNKMKALKMALFALTLSSLSVFSSPLDSVKRIYYYQDSISCNPPDSAIALVNGKIVAVAKFIKKMDPEETPWGRAKAVALRETHLGSKPGKNKSFFVIAGVGKYGLHESCPCNGKKIFFKKWLWPDEKKLPRPNDTIVVLRSKKKSPELLAY